MLEDGGTKLEVLCEGCPPVGYPTDKTRCAECPRRIGDHHHPVAAEFYRFACRLLDEHKE